MQGRTCVRLCLVRSFLKDLRFDRPHDHLGRLQKNTWLRLRADAEFAGQPVARLGEGFDHVQLIDRMALRDKALDDGAGHVAPADECDLNAHGFPLAGWCQWQIVAANHAHAVI